MAQPEFCLETLAALGQLTESQREVIIDRAVLGRTYVAIAKSMGCHHSNVQFLERRAKKLLAESLRPA